MFTTNVEGSRMGWAEDSNNEGREQQPFYKYKDGVETVNILPNTSREFLLLTGTLDKTGTWPKPIGIWVNKYMSNNNKGLVTLISFNFKKPCPLAFENELFKVANPNYKMNKQKLPYPVSKYPFLPVWDLTLNKMGWLLANKSIEKEMDFIFSNNANMYTGAVRISRIGKGMDSRYRVDNIPLPANVKDILAGANVIPQDKLDLTITRDEYNTKTGIDPVAYWQRRRQEMAHGQIPNIDISGWGEPWDTVGAQIPVMQQAQQWQPPVQQPAQVQQWQQPAQAEVDVKALAKTVIQSGLHKGKDFIAAFQASGMPFIKWFATAGQGEDNKVAKLIVENEAAFVQMAGGLF